MPKTNRPAEGLTSQEAVAAVGNRYELVLIAARRMRELRRGDTPKVASNHGDAVTALMEIQTGQVGRDYLDRAVTEEPEQSHKRRVQRSR